MKKIELGGSRQTSVSQLALGCMLMGTSTEEATARRMLDDYVGRGGNFLDTANCYTWFVRRGSVGGESEALLGRWLSATGRRDQVFLATKGGAMLTDVAAPWAATGEVDWTIARGLFEGAGRQTLQDALEGSLRRLQTDYVDLYYVHVDDRATPLEETLETLEELRRAGKIRHFGWSNVRTWRLERIRQLCDKHGWPTPIALQQQHTYLRRRPGLEQASIVDDEQLDYLAQHPDLTLVAYSPILKGLYDDPRKRQGHWAMQPYAGLDSEARLATVRQTASELGITPNQLVLAWLLQQRSPRVVPLVGPRTWEQYQDLLPALNVELCPEHWSRLQSAGA